MKQATLLILVAFASAFCVTGREVRLDPLLQHYIAAQEALASDNLEKARAALASMAEASRGELRQRVDKAVQGRDIEAVRREFIRVSEQLAGGDIPEGVVLVHCPMAADGKGADWIQRDGEVANPYFGARMLRCGIKKTD